MSKFLVSFLLVVICNLVFAFDVETIKADAAKRTGCSKDKPCHINYKSHDGIYVVKVTEVVANDSGVLKNNPKEYKRYVYNSEGKMIESLDDWCSKIMRNYRKDYHDDSVSEKHLANYFVDDVQEHVDDFIKSKSRYPSFTLRLLLDAPVLIQNEREIETIACDSKKIIADKCILITGKNYLDQKLEIYLGFQESDDKLLINHVLKVKPEKGSSFEWSK